MAKTTILSGIILDEGSEFTLLELSRACGRPAEWLLQLVEEGIIEPIAVDEVHWRFEGAALRRVQVVQRLQSDLGVNLPGAALALDLLDEVQQLRRKPWS